MERKMIDTKFYKAINKALDDCLANDDSVVLLGEDIAKPGGSFKVTAGLFDKYGDGRVRGTPISEATIVGMSVGAAMAGIKPVVEIMFMDFITIAMDALVNQAAKARYMFGGQCSVPMVVRMPHGGGLSAGPQHSQCLEAWFAHIPGLKVVVPSSVEDAYGLMVASINDPDPVVFVENKSLYGMKGSMPEQMPPMVIGKASVVREGDDITVVSYGASVHMATRVADQLKEKGTSVEVIDLRSIQPWDEQTVLESLTKTHRLVVFHEAVEAFGVGAEIVARMADVGFDELDAPIVRVGAPFMPVPFAKHLEEQYQPDDKQLLAAIERVMA